MRYKFKEKAKIAILNDQKNVYNIFKVIMKIAENSSKSNRNYFARRVRKIRNQYIE